jgi:ATP-dependent DNA helicase RecQ
MSAGEKSASGSLRDAEGVLSRFWRHDSFRPGQREVVESVLSGRDVLAVLPTGAGKSVCYQVPAVVLGRLTVVVSPLIALMQDQVAGLNARGVPATFINSNISFREAEQRWLDVEHGRYRLLYLAPERLETDTFAARAGRLPVDLLAVDEAHCISEWGPDFRPSYLRIREGAALLGRPPVIAVTATATPDVRRDIQESLGLVEPRIVIRGFDRPNIIPSVFLTAAKMEKLAEVMEAVPGSGIVYVSTRKGAETWASRIRAVGYAAEAYHAGLPAAERAAVQDRWQRNETSVIAATNAFGMGIDKPDVRFVVHIDIPSSVEAFYQEAGRAGRDGNRAYSVLLFAESDEPAARAFNDEGRPRARLVQAVYDAALSIAQIAIGSVSDAPFVLDVERVSRLVEASPLAVRSSAEVLVREGLWEEVRLPPGRGLINFRQPGDALRQYADSLSNRALASFVRHLLRGVHAEAFHGWTDMDLRALEKRTRLPRQRLLRGLEFLAQHDLVRFYLPGDGQRYRLAGARQERVHVDRRALEQSHQRAERRLADMIRYARSITCRRHMLLTYFGEPAPESCGSCDVCLGRHRPAVITPEDEPVLRAVLAHVGAGDPMEAWLPATDLPAHRVAGLADWLAHHGYISLADPLAGSYELTASGARFADLQNESPG